jgi:predicted type IV restriction endonuclease
VNPPEKVLSLVEVFERNADEYQSAHFNEAMLRQQFVNPLFKCLGWDMDNEQGYAEAYKEVIHEASLKIGGATKAPDYSFRIGGTPKFYLEAKKPSVNLKDDPAPAFQLRRYAWSAKMPLSILTNFKEFAVYDSRFKPAQTDKASTARILYLRCAEFAAAWDEKKPVGIIP